MVKILRYIKGFAVFSAIMAPLMMMLEVLMDLQQPYLMSLIINTGIANGDTAFVLSTGVKMVAAAAAGLFGGAACSIFAAIAAIRMSENLRAALFEKVQSFSFAELDKFKTSSLITRLTNDVTQVQQMVMMGMRIMVRAPLLCIGGLIMAVSLSPKLSVVLVAVIPLLLIVVVFVMQKSFPMFRMMQSKVDNVNNVMRENLLGIRVIKAFTMEQSQTERFDGVNEDLMSASVRAQNVVMILMPISSLLVNLSVIAVLWYGGRLSVIGGIEIGTIVAFINYLTQIMMSLMMVIMLVVQFSRAKASADRINEVLDSGVSIKNNEITHDTERFDIEFRKVSFRYHKHSEDVLRDISFTVKEGEKVGIIGSTGSGKSSLVALIPRLYDVTDGQVLVGGVDVREQDSELLRHTVGMVLQESILFSGTIADNLRFGDENADNERMVYAAQIAQAKEFIDQRENSYEATIEQRGKNLSGGQKQRLSIARTLVRQPKVLILDDCSSALDMSTEARLQDAIGAQMQGITVIIIAQRVSAVMDADKIIVLDEGRVSGIGTHAELMEQNEIYRTIAQSQL